MRRHGMAAPRSGPRRTARKAAKTARRKAGGGLAVFKTLRDEAYRQAYEQGYREGRQSGFQRFREPFEGTSIVIPTYNQLALVRQCIERIKWNTPEPYEIIVVDNGSTDGTGAYLRQTGGGVRCRVLDQNLGFSGAINVGLMMAKGRTIALLNNDTLVTPNWLANMLRCLYSDERIGMVGPVTNNISGSQQVRVPYSSLSEMPAFARRNNRSDPSRWRETDRLIGFCLLFRRELFEQVGYFDEGFEIGNYEDNDYSARVKLLGKKLVVAEDSFIHHIGSVSIKAVGDRMVKVNARNERFFRHKWQGLDDWTAVRGSGSEASDAVARLGASAFYPERIFVRGIGENAFWIEEGRRRPVEGLPSVPVVRISQVDLRRWPVGESISAEEAERRWHGSPRSRDESFVAKRSDGSADYVEGNARRKLIGDTALESWGLNRKPERALGPERSAELREGLPIVPLPVLKQLL